MLAQLLQRRSRLGLIEPIDGEALAIGRVYLGRPDERIQLRGDGISVTRTEGRLSKLQCIDDLFSSIARTAGPRSVGIILSGMLDDGTRGLRDIRAAGGTCIVQRPRDAEYQDMPMNALREVDAHFIGSAAEIANRLVKIAGSSLSVEERSQEHGA
jgi:two-component system chemotaxis response regulator CheB